MERTTLFYQLFSLLMSVLVFYYIYKTHQYLVRLDNCECAPRTYSDRLKHLEIIYLVLSLLGIVSNVLKFFLHKKEDLATNKKSFVLFVFIITFSIFIVHSLFVYNSYKFFTNMKKDCKCSFGWEKEVIAIQTFIYGLPIFVLIVGLIVAVVLNLMRSLAMVQPSFQRKK